MNENEAKFLQADSQRQRESGSKDTENDAEFSSTADSWQKNSGKAGLSIADQERLKKAQKRNLVIAIVFGLVLATLGFFAGQNLRAQKQDTSMDMIEISKEFVVEQNFMFSTIAEQSGKNL